LAQTAVGCEDPMLTPNGPALSIGRETLRPVPYKIEYSPEAVAHLALLTARQAATVLDMVPKQLAHQPTAETRNRAPMRPNPVAHSRLRIGTLRVYYDVSESPERVVVVKAVGIKVRDRVFIGREELKL
jgi:mRNA-degrading endonuclease RelE of RelBE toxin-antitoxin system